MSGVSIRPNSDSARYLGAPDLDFGKMESPTLPSLSSLNTATAGSRGLLEMDTTAVDPRRSDGNWYQYDRRLVTSSKTERILKERLAKSNSAWKIVIGDPVEQTYGIDEQLKPQVANTDAALMVEPTDSVVTFYLDHSPSRPWSTRVRNGPSPGRGNLMTPWMLLHRIGHAVSAHTPCLTVPREGIKPPPPAQDAPIQEWVEYSNIIPRAAPLSYDQFGETDRVMFRLLNFVRECYGLPPVLVREDNSLEFPAEDHRKYLGSGPLTDGHVRLFMGLNLALLRETACMSSAKNGRCDYMTELKHEFCAQYLYSGRISLRPPPLRCRATLRSLIPGVRWHSDYLTRQRKPSSTELAVFATALEESFDSSFRELEGKVIYSYDE